MSVVMLLACVFLLGGHWASSVSGAEKGCAFGKSPDANTTSCDNVQCSAFAPRTCKDVRDGEKRTVIKLADGPVVLCDTETDGGGWVVFQRRVSKDENFYRNWNDYKNGFGYISGNFWLGNEKIHRLTSQYPHELRVDLTFNGRSYFAQYSKFRISGETEKYKIEVGGYSGNAGDSFSPKSNGMFFSTKDRDNDNWNANCALSFEGAWWYNGCHTSNLNGRWGSKVYGDGLNWYSITGHVGSVTSTEMKIRPIV